MSDERSMSASLSSAPAATIHLRLCDDGTSARADCHTSMGIQPADVVRGGTPRPLRPGIGPERVTGWGPTFALEGDGWRVSRQWDDEQ
jgi:hypothetical protein